MRKIFRNLDRSVGRLLTRSIASFDGLKSRLGRRPVSRSQEPTSILAIKLVGLGDTVLMLTAIDRLREHIPNTRISVLVTPLSSGILDGQPQIDEVIVYDVLGKDKGIAGFLGLLRHLKRLRPDCTIDFEQHFQSTAILAYLVGSPRRIGLYYHDNPRRLLFTDPVFLNPNCHMVTSYVRLLEPLGITAKQPDHLVPVAVGPEDRTIVDAWMESLKLDGRSLIGIHTGSGIRAPAKRWPLERFVELIASLVSMGSAVILTGNSKEHSHCQQIVRLVGNEHVHNTAGRFSIKQTAHLVARCDLFISNDTGPMHIAAAMGTPTIGLFGPESPERYCPVGMRNRSIYQGASCSPCVEIYRGFAPDCNRPVCMENITVEDVLKAVAEYDLGR